MSGENDKLTFDDDGDPFGMGGSSGDRVEEVSDEAALRGILAMAPDDLGAIYSLGHIHRQRGEFEKAEALFRQVIALSGANHAAKAVACCNLGALNLKRGKMDLALENYEEACGYFRARENLEGLALALCNIGKIYRRQNDMDKAGEYFKKSLELNEKLEKRSGMIADYTSLGLICYVREDWGKAEDLYRKALLIEEEEGNKSGMAVMYGNIGAVAHKRGDLQTAREYWVMALELFREINAKQMMVKVQRWLDFLPK